MGANPNKLPNKLEWTQTIKNEIDLPLEEKKLFYLLWVHNHKPIGHSNLTFLEYGKEASMHLHLWSSDLRKKDWVWPFYTNVFFTILNILN